MDNPWSQEAAAPNSSMIAQEGGINSSLSEAQRQRQDDKNCFLVCLQAFVRVCHICDALFGLVFLIYGIMIRNCHLILPEIMTFGSGTLLVMRAASGLFSVNNDGMHRFGLRLSAVYLSPLFALLDLIVSFLCMGNHALLVAYLQEHQTALHLSETLVTFIETHHHALWILFLAFSLLELIRWYMIPIFQTWLLQMDTSFGSPDVELLYTPTNRLKRPWWWQHSPSQPELMQEPLLPNHWTQHSSNQLNYSIRDGINNSPTSFWARWFQSPQREEEEEEVDFASVQEEWASRSQEDPFWWSREEGESFIIQKEETKDEEADLSWATDVGKQNG